MFAAQKKTQESGFTLIELLVVLSIIALLSSVALSALGEARRKSRNANRQQDVLAYSKAVEAYQVNKGVYPDGGLNWSSGTLNVCLGRSSCFAGGYSGNAALDAQFVGEMPKVPPGLDTGLTLTGYAYACLGVTTSGGPCSQYRILYQLEGKDSSVTCAGGLKVQQGTGVYNLNNTQCEIIQCTGGKKPTLSGGGGSAYICQ